MSDGTSSCIHLPLTPEYIGYSDIGLSDGFFTATKPEIELIEDNLFKYHVDFSVLVLVIKQLHFVSPDPLIQLAMS